MGYNEELRLVCAVLVVAFGALGVAIFVRLRREDIKRGRNKGQWLVLGLVWILCMLVYWLSQQEWKR